MAHIVSGEAGSGFRIATKTRKPKRKRPALSPRKAPSQDRARHTVEAILQAASTVLVRDGYDRASTNRIAEAAGVSIGSLYQYFPSKEAVVKALVDRHENRMLSVMRSHLEDVSGGEIPALVAALIAAILEAHRVDPRLQSVLLEHGAAQSKNTVDDAIEGLVRSAIETRKGEIEVGDPDVAAFILVTAVRTVCHRAVVERADLLHRPAFLEELGRLVTGYLVGSRSGGRAPRARKRS